LININGLDRALSTFFRAPVEPCRFDMLRKAANTFNNNQAWDFGASKMRKLSLTITMAAVVVGLQATSHVARAADVGVYSRGALARVTVGGHCSRQWSCGPEGCGWQRFCRVGCPDRFSCNSLYGAYGPYGGTAYWNRYTSGGWGPSYHYR